MYQGPGTWQGLVEEDLLRVELNGLGFLLRHHPLLHDSPKGLVSWVSSANNQAPSCSELSTEVLC